MTKGLNRRNPQSIPDLNDPILINLVKLFDPLTKVSEHLALVFVLAIQGIIICAGKMGPCLPTINTS